MARIKNHVCVAVVQVVGMLNKDNQYSRTTATPLMGQRTEVGNGKQGPNLNRTWVATPGRTFIIQIMFFMSNTLHIV